VKSLRSAGSPLAVRASWRYSGAPWKNWRSVRTDRQAAPWRAQLAAISPEILPQHPPARARLLDLGYHRGLARSDLRAQGANEIPGRGRRLGLPAQRLERLVPAGGRYLVALDRQDAF